MPEYCLQLDVGNSSAKWRITPLLGFDSGDSSNKGVNVIARGCFTIGDFDSAQDLLQRDEYIEHIWVASVASIQQEQVLTQMLAQRWNVQLWFARTPSEAGGLRNSYKQPETMGVDRWLAMLAVRLRYQTQGQFCVIDAGSALTIDVVGEDGQHRGGYIIPGVKLMEHALLQGTDRVRFTDDIGYKLDLGDSTAAAVRHGVSLAQAGSVSLVMRRESLVDSDLYFCGGGGKHLMDLLEVSGQWLPDLVFEGLELAARMSRKSV